jgi:hypothetical protein
MTFDRESRKPAPTSSCYIPPRDLVDTIGNNIISNTSRVPFSSVKKGRKTFVHQRTPAARAIAGDAVSSVKQDASVKESAVIVDEKQK